MTSPQGNWRPVPGSFRDPASRVLRDGESFYRALDERGLAAWRALSTTRFFVEGVASNRIARTEEAKDRSVPTGWAGLLKHEAVETISYPYEWTFSMLRRAALLQLELMEAALAEDFILKDATPFNIQFVGARPLFIDIGSFEPLAPGDAWVGYRQFCNLFLFPLMLRCYRNIPFQPWLRGEPEGLTAAITNGFLRWTDRLKPGVLTNVVLQAKAEQRYGGEGRDVRGQLQQAGFNKQLIVANVGRLRKVVEGLVWKGGAVGWSGYADCVHVGEHRTQKGDFLSSTLEAIKPGVVVDFGANDGHFSRLAAGSGASVVAVDADEAVLDRFFLTLQSEPINTLLLDLANPSPSQGWALQERSSIEDRLRPQLIIFYAVVHHLVVARNIPLAAVIDWLRKFGCPLVFEFVGPEDEMVKRLSANKRPGEIHSGYDLQGFLQALTGNYTVAGRHPLPGGTRELFDLRPA